MTNDTITSTILLDHIIELVREGAYDRLDEGQRQAQLDRHGLAARSPVHAYRVGMIDVSDELVMRLGEMKRRLLDNEKKL